jgi:hypothetical protein
VSPLTYLTLSASVLGAGLALTAIVAVARSRRLLGEARRHSMQFSHPDRFDLGRRVAFKLPVPGAADVVVRDVAYATTEAGLQCVMTAAFTIGTVGRRRHLRRVCAALDVGGKELVGFQMWDGLPSPELYATAIASLRPAAGKSTEPGATGTGL